MNSLEYERIMESRELFKTMEKENIEKGLAILEELAESKSRYAIYELGKFYKEGKYVDKNIKKAFNLFVYSGELGNLKSFYDAGMIFKENKDYKNAKRYFEKAKYSLDAYLELGKMALEGRGMKSSKHQAFIYYNEASKLGSSKADYYLAEAYINGNGVKVDYKKGQHYLNKALRKHEKDVFKLEDKIVIIKRL